MVVPPFSGALQVRDPATVGPSAPTDRLVEELVRLTDAPDVRTQDLASLLAHLRPREVSAKLRHQVVSATRALLGRVRRYLPAEDLAEILAGLTPPYLAEGTAPETHELLASGLPRLGGHLLELDAESVSSILRSLATLPLDEPSKVAAADLLVAITPRLRDLASGMDPGQLAGCVQGLRLLRRANRPLMLELLALLLRRGIDASPWEPSSVLDLSRGLLTVRPDPEALTLAAKVLGKALPAIAPRCGELSISEVSEIGSVLGLVPALNARAVDSFLRPMLAGLLQRASDLTPADVATIIGALGHLRLEGEPKRLATSLAPRALLAQVPSSFSFVEVARVLTGLGGLDLDRSGAAVASAFALASVEKLRQGGEQLPARELAAVVAFLGRLPADSAGRGKFRGMVRGLLPELKRRAGRFTPEEQRQLLEAFGGLGIKDPLVGELAARWKPAAKAEAPAPPPASVTTPVAGPTPGGSVERTTERQGMSAAEVATDLGITRASVYQRLKKLRIPPPGAGGFSEELVGKLREGGARMPPKRKPKAAAGPRLSLGEAAAAVGTHRTAVARWLREEKALAGAVIREGQRIWFPTEAMDLLRQIHERRMAAAPESLRKAWAARKGTAASPGAPQPSNPHAEAVPAPRDPASPPPLAEASTAAHATAPDARDQAILRMAQAVEQVLGELRQIAGDFRDTVRMLLEHQQLLVDRIRPRKFTVHADRDAAPEEAHTEAGPASSRGAQKKGRATFAFRQRGRKPNAP